MRASRPRDLLAWALGRRLRVRVAGPSMEPSLPDGSTVLVKLGADADVGDVVLIRHPTDDELRILKRVDHLTTDGHLFLKGDAGTSTDSRDFGAVPPERLLGTVTCTLP